MAAQVSRRTLCGFVLNCALVTNREEAEQGKRTPASKNESSRKL